MTHSRISAPSSEVLTAVERDLLRRELSVRFSSPPRLVDGLHLRVWRTGLLAGQPKVPAAVQSKWLSKPLRADPFQGAAPVDVIRKNRLQGLRDVSRYLTQMGFRLSLQGN